MRTLTVTLTLALSVSIAAAACTKPVEGVCCVTEADCARLGVDEPRPCGVGQACKAFECVAAECTSAADCALPDAPVCVHGLCVASCRVDDDCAGAAGGPRCAEDGACVGCFTNADCPSSAPFCDAEDRSCRGCEADMECSPGVCLEIDGRCASEEEVVFVSTAGQGDTGDCRRSAPCDTLAYALTKLVPARRVIHLAGGDFAVADTILNAPVYIDGTSTVLGGDGSGPYFHITSSEPVTVANVTIDSTSGPGVTAAANATLRIYNTNLPRGAETTGGTIIAARSRFAGSPAMRCTAGVLSVEQCHFTSALESMNCQLMVSSSVFDLTSGTAVMANGRITIENNLFIQANELADTVVLVGNAPGSGVRFNTFVNTSAVVSDGVALYCDATLEVTSNIFAYGSQHPHGTSMCSARYSLYDAIALPDQTDGVENRVANGTTFFASKPNRDFHLAPMSPARGGAEAGSGVTRDLEGRLRPTPIGSPPDMGAFEAP